MNDDINLSNLFQKIRETKKTLISIISLSILFSLIYAFTQEETFKAEAYLIPPESRYTQPLNVFLEDGYRLTREEIEPSDIYRVFMLNLQSRKYQRKYFFDNKLYDTFDEKDYEKSFTENFHKNLNFIIESKITSRDFREQQFLTVSFIHNNPTQAAEWLNNYIKMVSKITARDFVDGINILIKNTKKTFESEITSKKNLALKITQDRIIQLEEALDIAMKLNIIDRDVGSSNQQSVVISEDESVHLRSPIYLYGVNALKAEISALKNRKNKDSFINGLRQLEQKVKSLESIRVNVSDVKATQIDQKAIPPEVRHSPKRKLIVLLGTLFGFVIAFFYILFSFIIRRN